MTSTRLNIHHYASAAASHAHADHSQLVFGLHGSLELELAGQGALVESAALAIIAPGDDHTFLSRDGGQCLVLDIPPQQQLEGLLPNNDQQQRLLSQTLLRTLSPQQSSLVSSLASVIRNQPSLADAGASLLIASLLQQPVPAERLPLRALDAYIDSHLAFPIEARDLARIAGTSSSRLRHWFSLEQGCSPMAYVRHRRLSAARQLLQRSAQPIALIAERCGYSSQSAFAQVFKQRWGLSPRAARQQALHNNIRVSRDSLRKT